MIRVRSILLLLVTLMAFPWSVDADRLSLDRGLRRPFYAPAINIQWAAPTNSLPRTAIVFETVADPHPEVTVSNLMLMGGFRWSDKISAFNSGTSLPKRVCAFSGGSRTLFYDPRWGTIDFTDNSAFRDFVHNNVIEGIPDEATVLNLALRLLPKLGISSNDMVKEESGALRCVFPTGSSSYGSEASQVHRRGVGFGRSLDGKEVDGWRAVFMEFGNKARLGTIEVRWCALRPKGSYPVAQPAQLLRWVREGRAVVLSVSGPTDARYVRVADIRKLTITSIQARYPYMDDDNPSKHLYPYASLTARAEFETNDSEQVFLSCPLIAEGLPKPQRPGDAGFSIYPSKRRRLQLDQ